MYKECAFYNLEFTSCRAVFKVRPDKEGSQDIFVCPKHIGKIFETNSFNLDVLNWKVTRIAPVEYQEYITKKSVFEDV